jgi:site-specific DNA-methyltransferase (adenine-specific)
MENNGPWCDLIVTSPPYNLGLDYGPDVNDKKSEIDYSAFTTAWLTSARRSLTKDGSLFLNVGSAPRAQHRPHQVIGVALDTGWKLQNTFHWIKSIAFDDKEGNLVTRGHFKPINSKRFVNDCHEFVFHLTLTGDVEIDRKAIGVPYSDKSNLKRWAHTAGADLRCAGNNWLLPYETIQSSAKDRPHPATFPVELARRCIALTKPQHVCDPFVGIGSTGIAARAMGVPEFTGIDLTADYLTTAKRRIFE